jgi:hypothetical protein
MPEPAVKESPERVKYAVFGCGSIGYNIIQELTRENNPVIVIDRDEKRVKELRDQNYDALNRDVGDPAFLQKLPLFEIAFVMTGDHAVNVSAVRIIKEKYPAVHIVARAVDPISAGLLEAAGAEYVLYPQQVVAKAAIHQINKIHANRISQRLFTLLSGWEGTLGIITHNNPDPDAISSAMALVAIARSANPKKLACRILYDGIIGHQENRTMVNLLETKMERITPALLQECTYLALVDCSAPGMNNGLSPRTRVQIVIDHHRDGHNLEPGIGFVDIRPGLGATASILTQYMQELDIPTERDCTGPK